MKNELSASRVVDRYLDGMLDEESVQLFTERLKTDVQLKEQLHHQEQIHRTLKVDREIIEFERQLNDIFEQTYQPFKKTFQFTSRTRQIVLKTTSIAAGLALLTFTGLRVFNGSNSATELYNIYYKPAEINMSFRTAGDVVDSELRKAMMLYENKNYVEAINLFEKILKDDNSRIGLNLYTGISHMEIEQYEKANSHFQNIIDHKANAFVESAEWYLGLCYLKTNDNNKAELLFDRIIAQKGYYHKEAKKIKKSID